jgi:hypothetical protein
MAKLTQPLTVVEPLEEIETNFDAPREQLFLSALRDADFICNQSVYLHARKRMSGQGTFDE